jgi:hypothetical protein
MTGLKAKKIEPTEKKKMEETLRVFEQQALEDEEERGGVDGVDGGECFVVP